MVVSPSTKNRIIRALDDLPPESLASVAEFVEFLRAKIEASHPAHPSGRIVNLAHLWQGYSFSEEEIQAARRETWAGLGQAFDA